MPAAVVPAAAIPSMSAPMSTGEVRSRIDLPRRSRCSALLAPDHVRRDAALREQRIDHEPVAGVDDLLVPQVDDDQVALGVEQTRRELSSNSLDCSW